MGLPHDIHKEHKEADYHRIERAYGSFQRILSLPDDADQEGIDAQFKNGVMTTKVPQKAVPESESTPLQSSTIQGFS